jgi:phosphinothricin acetyltransferase
MSPLTTRLATPGDSAAIARVYNQGIADRTATFETEPRTEEDIRGWFGAHPIAVALRDGAVIAFAASSRWRAHERYRGIAEFSVYVDRAHRGQGAGRAVLEALLVAAEQAGLWKLLGALFSDNAGSRALMLAAGFREIGFFERQAQLDGVWRDIVMFEKRIPSNEK